MTLLATPTRTFGSGLGGPSLQPSEQVQADDHRHPDEDEKLPLFHPLIR